MELKYIVTEHKNDDGKLVENIFLFPLSINHNDFMESIWRVKHHNGSAGWKRVTRKAIAAGFWTPSSGCYGRSETLNLDSRGNIDTALVGKS